MTKKILSLHRGEKLPVLAAVSCAVPDRAATLLQKYCADVVFLPPDPLLASPVASHADMLLFSIGDALLTHRRYYDIARPFIDRILSCTGLRLVLTDCPRSAEYPLDIALNALLCGKYLFGRLDALAPELLTLAAVHEITPVSVKQGYAGCSGLVIGDTLLTADPSLQKGAAAHGIPFLSVPDRGILLPGYDHGFFGGCGGVWEQYIFLCGTPNPILYAPVYAHAARLDMEILPLGDGPLYDCGGIRFFSLR